MSDPLGRLRDRLAAARRDGEPFGQAWASAVDAALDGLDRMEEINWRAAIVGTADAWRAAYNREPYEPTASAVALAAA